MSEGNGMRAIIYGAGGIGCVVGGHLALAGAEVVLIGRPGHVSAVNERGLRFITPTGTHTLHLPAVTSPSQVEFRPGDVVFLCVKGQDTDQALRDLRRTTADVPVFCLQNGVRNEEIASRLFERVYGVMVRVGSVYVTDGDIIARRDPPGALIIGRYPSGEDEVTTDVTALLRRAGFMTMATKDIMPYKWGKLMLNLGNAIGAITNARPRDTAGIYQAAAREASDLLDRAGIRRVSNEQLTDEWPEISARPRGVIRNEAQSSTWQSLARRQGTVETDFLNGEIVRLAGSLGARAPVNETLLRITSEMAANGEPPGKLSPEELSRLAGLG